MVEGAAVVASTVTEDLIELGRQGDETIAPIDLFWKLLMLIHEKRSGAYMRKTIAMIP